MLLSLLENNTDSSSANKITAYIIENCMTPTPPIIFVHGIKGAHLVDANDQKIWPSLRETRPWSRMSLGLPLRWRNGVQDTDSLRATGPISRVAWIEVYSAFLKWAESERKLYSFCYDWRRDNIESMNQLIAFVENIHKAHENRKPQIVAHSMGGLISLAALHQRPELFHSILFAGVPFGPSINFVWDMHLGVSFGLNRNLLSEAVHFSFVSPYVFFPDDPEVSLLLDIHGNAILHDWYCASDWEKAELSVFHPQSLTKVKDIHRLHLQNALLQANSFRQKMKGIKGFPYPPIAVLRGTTQQTCRNLIQNGPAAKRGWDCQSGQQEPGDGRVPARCALPPKEIQFQLFETPSDHTTMLSDIPQVSTALEFLCNIH